jgi:hypothetical protein
MMRHVALLVDTGLTRKKTSDSLFFFFDEMKLEAGKEDTEQRTELEELQKLVLYTRVTDNKFLPFIY